ncbi:hypothetical protein OVA06_19620 [Pseudarthrobacter sp. SL88]|uniref:hypothetical protein n=1 Tax=Pseudarthrobacter sp. SL88 TaxID=2994666 RepID=UPI0022738EF5|nr:hypothetical protein [Pseudarthrobacter sp. SL88]MCY1675776.1 hypothetical protein [Pseudarthrobacter sp. SL88]MCY1676883.1 hypothetical protein [Pseudarthrobacter sp. SL88]
MQWLTREVFAGSLSVREEEKRDQQWRDARQLVRTRLHSGAEQLIEINVHDGVIERLHQVDTETVELRALIGDNESGYEWLHVRYRGATLTIIESGFAEMAGPFELLRDELTAAADGSFLHSMITDPCGEFDIVFTSVQVTRTPTSPDERMALMARAMPLKSPN